MTDAEVSALVQLLMNSTAIGRLARDEVEKALRLAEDRGWTIKAPAQVA